MEDCLGIICVEEAYRRNEWNKSSGEICLEPDVLSQQVNASGGSFSLGEQLALGAEQLRQRSVIALLSVGGAGVVLYMELDRWNLICLGGVSSISVIWVYIPEFCNSCCLAFYRLLISPLKSSVLLHVLLLC